MANHECLSCGAAFASRKKLSSHKPNCKATEILTHQIFKQGQSEKRPHHASPMLSDARNVPEADIAANDLFELYGSHDNNVEMGNVSPQSDVSLPSILSKCSGRQIRMLAWYADFLPGTATHLEHMPPTLHQQRGHTQDQLANSPIPQPDTPSEESQSSDSRDLDTSFTTVPDAMGMYCVYLTQLSHAPIDTLNNVTDALNLEDGTQGVSNPVAHNVPEPDYFAPFTNPSCGLLMAYQYSGTSCGSANQLDRLPSFLTHPLFHAPNTRTFSHACEADRLNKYLEMPDNPFCEEHGWKSSTVKIRLPKEGVHFNSEKDAPEFEILGIYHRDMTDIIHSVFKDKVFSTFNT
ncbi:hypothetical protein J3R83DRAFT_8323 [Lanmaoa asiatica]|nr:hypothetical protein J3R83DRAFT_8323 [Lanmaoa asiatica]